MSASSIWARNGGLYLGFFASAVEGTPPAIAGRPRQIVTDRHVMVFGPNGSGKSRRALLPQLASLLGWLIIGLDMPKSEPPRVRSRITAGPATRSTSSIPTLPAA